MKTQNPARAPAVSSRRNGGPVHHGSAPGQDDTRAEHGTGEMYLKETTELQIALDEHAIMSITDLSGRINFVNDKFCSISAYSREGLLGQDHRIINSGHHPKAFFQNLWQTITSGKVWHGQIRNRAGDGSLYWVATTIVPFSAGDGKPHHYVSIGTDITEQKRLESQIEEKLLLEHLLANLSSRFAGLPSAQVDTAIQDAQQLIVETMDLDRSTLWQYADEGGEMLLTHNWQKPGWSPLPALFNAKKNLPWSFAKVMNGEGFFFSSLDELPHEAKQDAEMFRMHRIESNVTFPLIANGKVFGALSFATLGKERNWKKEEIANLKLMAQIIGNVVGRRHAEARAEQLRAEIARSARAAMLGEMAAALAHELNQPLTAILSNVQAAQRFLAGGHLSDGEFKSIFEDIERDSKRAGGVIYNLRNMLGKTAAERETCTISGIVHDVSGMLHGELVAQKVELVCSLADNLPQVEATPVELQQILMNLLLNGIQAMKETPHQRRALEIRATARDHSVVISVRDHGSGIEPGQLARIFDPFYTTKSSGLGMGLAICRRFVESHGGGIEAHNNRDGGATFTFSLPAHGEGRT